MPKQSDGGTESAIRASAQALSDAIIKGRSEGLVVNWPSRPEGLASIAISETRQARPALAKATAAIATPAPKVAASGRKAADSPTAKTD